MMNRKMMVNREAERPMAEVRARRGGMGPVRARPLPETEPMYKKGGSVKESKSMMKKEVAFMKKKGAPKSMIRHEEKEAGMKKGTKKMAGGGMLPVERYEPRSSMGMRDAVTGGRRMAAGGITLKPPKFQDEFPVHRRETRLAGGGSVGSFRKAADGVASKGKTKGKIVKMNKGGYC